MFRDDVWKLHSIAKTIIFDRAPQFDSKFWKALGELLEIEPHLSSTFYPETDGQREQGNEVIKQYLRDYVSYQEDDWASRLSVSQFSSNIQMTETTQHSLFMSNFGFSPRLNEGLGNWIEESGESDSVLFAVSLVLLHDNLRAEMKWAQDRYEEGVNTSQIPAPSFKVGHEVWLSATTIRTVPPSMKLDHKCLGKVEVVQVISPYKYKLTVTKSMKIHPVFHVWLSEPVLEDPIHGQVTVPPDPVFIQGQEKLELQEILDSRLFPRRPQYLIKWFGDDQTTWEPTVCLEGTPAMVEKFHCWYPAKPGPWKPRTSSAVSRSYCHRT